MPCILVVGDDPQIRNLLSEALPLQWERVTVVTASDGDEALQVFFAQQPELVLLDVILPGLVGFEVLRQIRQVSDTPVILLTNRSDETDQVRGLQLGADDYVIKPFSTLTLVARMRAILRRTTSSPLREGDPDVTVGPLMLSPGSRQVAVHRRPVDLTPNEFKLLYHLARNAGQVMAHETLMTRIWGLDSYRTADHLRVCVSRLQAKIEHVGGPRCIENERGFGYRLVAPSPIAHQS
jgi:two-component system KDP operon response regulator KdpE